MNKLALLFPGQGSQAVGMGKNLCKVFPVAHKTFEEANEVLGFDLMKMCFEGNIEELTRTENAQPAILTCSVAAFRVYMSEIGVEPVYSAGHSLGEFSALTCAGAIAFEDALKIVRKRGRFMQEAAAEGIGSMAAVTNIDRKIIEEECINSSTEDSIVAVSNYNAPDQTVISGHKDAVDRVTSALEQKGAKIIPLKVSAPFHSSLMKPAAVKLNEEMRKYAYNSFKWPVISNVTGLPYSDPSKIIENMTQQMTAPVQWVESMMFLQSENVNIAIELGAGKVLKNLVKKNSSIIVPYSYDIDEDVKKVKELLKNDDGNIENRITVVTKCLAAAVCTKNRNWDNEEYQKGVVQPYKAIQVMQNELEANNKMPSIEQMTEALNLLKSIFDTKKVPIEEQIERFNDILDKTKTKDLFPDFVKDLH
jgi:[acyl-carrier-protein] S-malonyltransferase